jgi:hypothetical protein
MTIPARNPLNELRYDAFQRFVQRDRSLAASGNDSSAVSSFWSVYGRSIAGLPSELRVNGLLATLAMRGARYREADDATRAVLDDLKWADGREELQCEAWIEEVFAARNLGPDGTQPEIASFMNRQKWLMDSAQAMKQIAGQRLALAKFQVRQDQAARSDETEEDDADSIDELPSGEEASEPGNGEPQ